MAHAVDTHVVEHGEVVAEGGSKGEELGIKKGFRFQIMRHGSGRGGGGGIVQGKHLRDVDDDHRPGEHGVRACPVKLALLVDVWRYSEGKEGYDGHDGTDEHVSGGRLMRRSGCRIRGRLRTA